jgi:serine/threonine protein kinase
MSESSQRRPASVFPASTAGPAPAADDVGGASGESDPTLVSARPPDAARVTTVAEIGRTLEGRFLGVYRLDRFIGGGGMGAVFRALDTTLDRVVAVKVLSRQQSGDDELLRRFRNEAQSAARLDHENIGRVYAVGADEGWHYIVFEFIEGTNLREVVLRDGPFDVGRTIDVTMQVAAALEHASRRGVVHRDIKPSNIIITPEGRARVVDMGLARLPHVGGDQDLTVSGMTLGTFDYISPEQARDPRRADVRSDLYSLGCTIFFMLAGRPPFHEGTMVQKLLQHQQDPPPAIEVVRPDIPRRLAGIVRRLMEKNPQDRYQRPADLEADLAALADELGIEIAAPRPLPAAPAPPRPRSRHLPWLVSLAGLLAVVGGLWLRSATRPAPAVAPAPRTAAAETGAGPGDAAAPVESQVWRVVDAPSSDVDFGTLGEALRQASDGETIEIATADPRDDGPYVVEGKRIVIRAAEGVQPLVRFVEPPSADRADLGCISVVSGTLELQGVALQPAFLITGAARPAVVALDGAAVLRCRDVAFRLPVGDATPLVAVRLRTRPGERQELSCEDVDVEGGAAFAEIGPGPRGAAAAGDPVAAATGSGPAGAVDLFWNGGAVAGTRRFLLAEGTSPAAGGLGLRLVLEEGLFACSDGFACLLDSSARPALPRLQAFARECVFTVPEGRPFLEQAGIGDLEAYRPAIEWSDAASRYEGTGIFRRIDSSAERTETGFESLQFDHSPRIGADRAESDR